MGTTQEVQIRLTADTRDAVDKIQGAKRSFTELNQAFELAKKAAGGLEAGFRLAADALAQGGKVLDLERSFEKLSTAAGKTTSFLGDLRNATEGAINNADLMALANKALTLDLERSGVSFVELTGNVKKLADATGVDAAQAIESATQALATGRTVALNALGVTVDLTDATEDYAKSLGKSVDQLTESEQKIIRQRAAAQALEQAVAKLGNIQDNAGDSAEALGASVDNLVNDLKKGFAASEDLRNALAAFRGEIDGIDFAKIGEALGMIAAGAVKVAEGFIYAAERLKEFYDLLSPGQAAVARATDAAKKFREEQFKSITTVEELNKRYAANATALAGITEQIETLQSRGVGKKLFGAFPGGNPEDQEKLTSLLNQQKEAIARNEEFAKRLKELSAQSPKVEKLGETFGSVAHQATQSTNAIKQAQAPLEQLAKTTTELEGSDITIAPTVDLSQAQSTLDQFFESGGLEFGDTLEEQIQNSADFFQEVFYDAFQGSAFDFELLFKKVLSGIAAGAAGSLFPSLGVFSNPQQLGQSIGQSLIGSGASSALGSLLGGGEVAAGAPAGAIGQNADGTFILSSGASTSGSILGTASSTGAAAAVAATVAVAVDSALKILKGKKISDVSSAILALPTFGASLLVNPLVDAFGSGKSGDQQQRDAIRKQLQDSGFLDSNFSFSLLGSGGRGNLGAERFQGTKLSDALGPGVDPRALGLTSGISQIITGGDDKLSQDFNNMLANITSGFSDATDASQNFNEILANVMGVMDQLGLTVDGTKDQLKNMFLDGTVSLQEFHDGLQGLNLVAQENLVGEGSISDALQILANNFDNPKNQLAALELLMNEAKEVGISDISDLGAHIETTLGVTAAATFQKFENAGINSFEDLQNASADQIFLIISGLYDLKDQFYDTFDISSSADSFERNSSRVQSALGKTKSAAASAAEAQKKYNEQLRAGVSAQNNGGDDNKALNKTRR